MVAIIKTSLLPIMTTSSRMRASRVTLAKGR